MTDLRLDSPVVTVGDSTVWSRPSVHNFGPNRVDGRPRPADRSTAGSAPSTRRSTSRSARTQPVVFNHTFTDARRPPGRGPDRRRPAQARQPPLAGRPGPRVAQRAPGRRPLQDRAVPGRDRLPGPGPEPRGRRRPGPPRLIRTEVVAESQLSRRDLAPYDAVVLCNIAQFTEAEVVALDDYLKQGGGVVVFGGDQVVADNYNRLLYADGKGLLPARSGRASATPAKKEVGLRLRPARTTGTRSSTSSTASRRRRHRRA